jgi:hypothetical protein
MKLFSKEIVVAATAYAKAETKEQAEEMFRTLLNKALDSEGKDGDIPFSGEAFNSPTLPVLSVSPAMTIVEVRRDEAELVDE